MMNLFYFYIQPHRKLCKTLPFIAHMIQCNLVKLEWFQKKKPFICSNERRSCQSTQRGRETLCDLLFGN